MTGLILKNTIELQIFVVQTFCEMLKITRMLIFVIKIFVIKIFIIVPGEPTPIVDCYELL